MAPSSDYTARHLSVLEGLEAVRKRPGMYIGSTDSRGLMHCLWEIIDNSVDEALAGFGQNINVILHPDGSVEIHDDGRGIPVDTEPKTGLTGVEVVFTKLHAGGKFGGGSYTASGGLHGVGASVVNALSARLDVAGGPRRQDLRDAVPPRRARAASRTPGRPEPDADFEPFLDSSVLDVVGKAKRGVTGTRDPLLGGPPDLHPGRQVLLRGAAGAGPPDLLPGPGAAHRRSATSAGLPGHPGRRTGRSRRSSTTTAASPSSSTTSPTTRRSPTSGGSTVRARSRSPCRCSTRSGHSRITEVERVCEVDVALRWGIGYDTTLRSFVNIIATPKGGTHQTGFEQALLKTFRKVVEANARKLKAGNDKIEKDDVTRRPDRRADRPPGRAPVRGPDQGDPGHLGGAPDRLPRGREGAHRAAQLHGPRRQGPGGPAAGKGGQRDEVARFGARAQGDPAPQERPGDLLAADQAGRLPQRRRGALRTVHRRGRLSARAPRSWPAPPTSRPCCRSAARS